MRADVTVRQENRKSLALRVTPEGIGALIPSSLDPDGPRVRHFIERGLERLPQPVDRPASLTPEALRDLVTTWAERIGVQVGRVQIRSMRTKWASCSSQGTLTLSRDLLRLPSDLVDYVICHELVHLKVPSHGKGWRALTGIYIPEWRDCEAQLAAWALR